MLGLAESLASELNIRDLHQRATNKTQSPWEHSNDGRSSIALRYKNRQARIRLMLEIHSSILSMRLKPVSAGAKEVLDTDIETLEELSKNNDGLERSQLLALCKLGRLGHISRSANNILFQRQQSIGPTLRPGDRSVLLRHFFTLLQAWYDDFVQTQRKNHLSRRRTSG